MRPIVIGIGNPYRHDDGVGLAIIEAVAELGLAIDVVEELGEPAALVERWQDRELAILVDAAESGSQPPGTVHHFEVTATSDASGLQLTTAGRSSHALGVQDAIEFGRALDRMPTRLVILGVEVADMSSGTGLTQAVRSAVAPVVELIAEQITQATTQLATTQPPPDR